MVQLLTGPLIPASAYKGLTGAPWPEMRRLTARNLQALSDIGKAHNVRFFLEALTWTPLYKLEQVLELLDATERDNVGMVVDFWHLWDGGATAEQIAKLNKDIIYCVHFCDSLRTLGPTRNIRATRSGRLDRWRQEPAQRVDGSACRRQVLTACGRANC